jgi:small subunit ribosomal protein S4
MSRYTGPRLKQMRALGVDLPGLSRKRTERRPYPPGEHGSDRRKRPSDYARQLQEKQKLRRNYGVSERQLLRYYNEANASKAPTGERLIELLESRMDCVVFRANLAPTIPAARQLVNHRHFVLNGRRSDIPSIQIKPGDVLQLRDKSKEIQIVADALASPTLTRPDWLDVNEGERSIKMTETPPGSEAAPFPLDINLVVELYSR